MLVRLFRGPFLNVFFFKECFFINSLFFNKLLNYNYKEGNSQLLSQLSLAPAISSQQTPKKKHSNFHRNYHKKGPRNPGGKKIFYIHSHYLCYYQKRLSQTTSCTGGVYLILILM